MGIFAQLCADVLQLRLWLSPDPFQTVLAEHMSSGPVRGLPCSSLPEAELLASRQQGEAARARAARALPGQGTEPPTPLLGAAGTNADDQ